MKLNHLILIAALTAATSAFANQKGQIGSKIVGGIEASIGEFPFIVSFQSPSFGGHFCGGSLIKKNWVLTAAHCASYISRGKVVIGLHDQRDSSQAETINPKRVIKHPLYNGSTLEYDFALVELEKDSRFEPVAMNAAEIDIPKTAGDEIDSITAGWGATREGGSVAQKLQKVNVPLVNAEVCNVSYNGDITDSMICAGFPAGGKDACQGDSGGPLVVVDENRQHVLVGVVSWGQGCARPNYYGVYSKVNSVTDWIADTAK